MKIVADNTVPFLKGIAEPIAEVKYLTSKEFTPENVQDADILIVRSIDKCTRELLEGSRVKLITSATIGFDHIDTRYCDKAGITWKNSPGCNAVSVAQYVLSGLVTIALRKGEPLQGKTIGIVGVGHVGKEVEKLCSAYGMNVLRNDPPRAEKEGKDGFVSLETIAEQADIVTFHTPLTKEGRFATRHLAGEDFFRKLQRKPWFVNASRGAVHDTDALLHARKEGKISECTDLGLLGKRTGYKPGIIGTGHDSHPAYCRFLGRRESQWYAYVSEKHRKILPSEDREDQRSDSASSRNSGYRLESV